MVILFCNTNELNGSKMKTPVSTPSSAQKPKRNFLAEFLPLYKKSDENYATESTDESSAKLNISSSKKQSDSMKRTRPSSRYQDQVKEPVEVTKIIIDGSNLSTSGTGSSTPLNNGNSTPVANQKAAKFNKAKSKKNASAIEHSQTMDKVSVNLSKSSSNKRSKSVSFNNEENVMDVVKKQKSNNLNEEVSGNDGKLVKKAKKQEKNRQSNQLEKTKKQKHQGKPEIENAKPKTKVLDNLENLNLGDNSRTLTNLIDEMTVVDKKKLKKQKKSAKSEKKEENQHKTYDNNQCLNETGNSENDAEMVEKKKWASKRWNKQQLAKRDQNTSIIVDNLPVSLLNGNYKKVLIDHFSKYGLSRSVGEPVVQNEEDPNSVFTTKVFFDTVDAAAEALEMDETTIAGHEIQVSQMRPLTETAIVLRVYGPIEKLLRKDIIALFRDVGLIRSIRPLLKKKKTMSTVVVEFDSPKTVKRALEKCADHTINGLKIMANKFVILKHEPQGKTEKRKRQRGGKKGAKKLNKINNSDGANTDSGDSDDE